MVVKFYKVNDEYGCFSNFSKYGFMLDDKYWPSSRYKIKEKNE